MLLTLFAVFKDFHTRNVQNIVKNFPISKFGNTLISTLLTFHNCKAVSSAIAGRFLPIFSYVFTFGHRCCEFSID